MSHAIDFSAIPDQERVAFYGLLFAIAAADGSFDAEEMVVIQSMLDVTDMNDDSLEKIRSYRVSPPDFAECLVVLADCRDELRHGTMMSLVDIALADGILTEAEEQALEEAGRALAINDEQVQAMLDLVEEAADILNRNSSTDLDNSQIRGRARVLAESGITHSAAFFSGIINRLISVAPEAVANALNIGLGRIPGAPISVIVGSTVQITVSELLSQDSPVIGDEDGQRRKLRRERAHEAIEHLQSTIEELMALIADSKNQGADVDIDIETLEARCDGLRQLARTRRSALEEG